MHKDKQFLRRVILSMKKDKGSIPKIRNAVKYVKSSPSRLDSFMECAADAKVSYKGVVVLDVETR
ncbi:HAT family dimerization domain containing protein [Trifolium medium]|uniref:HAT family dimerization domain containing protein n=1 Tax=Trifolium medium TaxID=97028 RepID=A0A392PLY6_9FABA|nr:HAT family dimerization domain containing protein [Trifolium medium]